ncbi:uncharacterized protein LOC100890725 [Strongylocentrotus purpuratus]|uniref:Uncharacterized protein n=1 Tax=Strongylocentrotus purpuratus TaxID=7668 RepID=A0A7M7GHS5_STRPU|nr:uncharacterized protein LOC100890725 [Strongylocentrotus purpuratus]
MSSSGKLLGLFSLLFVFCVMTEATPGAFADNRVNVPQKQTFINVPMNQEIDVEGSDDDVDSTSSESSTSSEVDTDTDTDTDTNDADAATGLNAVGSGDQVGGNLLPILSGNGKHLPNTGVQGRGQNQMFGRESGSSGQSVGIAFAVLALVALVVVGAFFVIRRQRSSHALARYEEQQMIEKS